MREMMFGGIALVSRPIVSKLNHAMVEAMHTPALHQALEKVGLRIVPDNRATPQYLDGFLKSELANALILREAEVEQYPTTLNSLYLGYRV